MAYVDRTHDFKDALSKHKPTHSDRKRAASHRTSNPALDPENLTKQYKAEAYVILGHVDTLSQMLATIRKPYLNVDARSTPLARQTSRIIDLNDSEPSWANVRYLSNEERDQIDMQARVILTRCADRVKEMEALEKRRAELVAGKESMISRFLPSRLRQDASTAASDFLAAHHSSMTWYLNRRLAETSQVQKELQEERVARQLERTKTLGSGASREAYDINTSQSTTQAASPTSNNWLGEASSSLIAATLGVPSPENRHTYQPVTVPPSDDEDEEIELSASQILQFETENANILRSVQDTLESVQRAESRLMEISALQMELVTHLTQQTEVTDQLYEDAIATSSTVEKGNEQLKEAKRRAKDGRLFILVFLIGASISLLFLHYY